MLELLQNNETKVDAVICRQFFAKPHVSSCYFSHSIPITKIKLSISFLLSEEAYAVIPLYPLVLASKYPVSVTQIVQFTGIFKKAIE
jgi:hypothetical protein